MRRRPLTLAAAAAWLAIVISVVVNYATQLAPDWTRNPTVIFPALGSLAALSIAVAIAMARHPAPLPLAHLDSLRPPTLDVTVRGRERELSRLLKLVKRPRSRFAVVCGAGGTGKSTLAAELAARTKATVWWIHWRGPESFATQMMEALNLPRANPDQVWEILGKRSDWLLVIDNIDRPQELSLPGEPLSQYRGWVRPSGGGLLLVTSRDTEPLNWGSAAELIFLDPLSTEDAATVLLDVAPNGGDCPAAEDLASRLGGFPLAIHAASRAIVQPTARHRTFDAYSEAVDANPTDTLALVRDTWELSLDQLSDEGHPTARPLLRILSLTADAPFPRDLIGPALIAGNPTSAAVDRALAGLHRYGLVAVREGPIPCVTMHSLIREINAPLAKGRAALNRILLTDAQRTAAAGRAGWERATLLAPHLATVQTLLSARRTVDRFARMLDAAGDGPGMYVLWTAFLSLATATLGPDHPDTLSSRCNLATALRYSGDGRRAVELFERIVVDYERALGSDHRDTLGVRNNLAEALRDIGDYRYALELHERTFSDRERVLGPDHPETLASRSNVAAALREVGEVGRAVELLERIVADRERVSGPSHPGTLRSRSILATAFSDLGALRHAVELFEPIIAEYDRELGPDHPETLASRNNFAAALRKAGEVGRAEELFEQTMAECVRALGQDHPLTRTIRNNLAATRSDLVRRRRWRLPWKRLH